MLRYIKVNGSWIDTLEMQKKGYYYYIIEGIVYVDIQGEEIMIGKIEEQRDE